MQRQINMLSTLSDNMQTLSDTMSRLVPQAPIPPLNFNSATGSLITREPKLQMPLRYEGEQGKCQNSECFFLFVCFFKRNLPGFLMKTHEWRLYCPYQELPYLGSDHLSDQNPPLLAIPKVL